MLLPLLVQASWFGAAGLHTRNFQVNYQRSPALGVGPSLRFSWEVLPTLPLSQRQTYRISIIDAVDYAIVFDSGTVQSNATANIEVNARTAGLAPGTKYYWTTHGGVRCENSTNCGTFITALWDGFGEGAQWIWPANLDNARHFASVQHTFREQPRRDHLHATEPIVSALLFIGAWQEPTMLMSFKASITPPGGGGGATIVAVGPGRGEADVLNGNCTFRHAPYVTADITSLYKVGAKLQIDAMAPLFSTPCKLHACTDYNEMGGGILARVVLSFADGTQSHRFTNINADDDDVNVWYGIGLDDYYRPTAIAIKPDVGIAGLADVGETAYAKHLEHIDASKEPAGWKTSSRTIRGVEFTNQPPPLAPPPGWSLCALSNYSAFDELFPKMARPIVVYPLSKEPVVTATPNTGGRGFLIDFGINFQGGLSLDVVDGVRGQIIRIITGELLLPNGTIDNATQSRLDKNNVWGYGFNWTLRDGVQNLEQHSYMLFRYAALMWTAPHPPPSNWTLSAWGVKYEYVEASAFSSASRTTRSDANNARTRRNQTIHTRRPPLSPHKLFKSSDPMLNQVYELARYTLDGGIVDTYTDSNTRERRPYECDGLVAATSRLLIQSDAMWGRHSHSWVLETPTWPVEWQQMSVFLAFSDYWATGSVDFFKTYEQRLYDRTQVALVDSTGLVNTSTGRHLVGWDPAPNSTQFINSAHASASNAWAAAGLAKLAIMATVADSPNASRYAAEAKGIRDAMHALLWDATATPPRYCDGVCDDAKVQHHGGVTTNYFTLFHDLVPAASVNGVWNELKEWGLEHIGDYGAWVFLNALAMTNQATAIATRAGDDGAAMLTALTKCDEWSWCREMEEFNATMTTEGFAQNGSPHATMSHPWGTAALHGIVHGIIGLTQHAPAWSEFAVVPRLSNISYANIAVPTMRGTIEINVTRAPPRLSVRVPCSTLATLCLQLPPNPTTHRALHVDGVKVSATTTAHHVCADEPLACKVAPRVLTFI